MLLGADVPIHITLEWHSNLAELAKEREFRLL